MISSGPSNISEWWLSLGKDVDVIAKHIQMHMELPVITRLHEYLHNFERKPVDSISIKIRFPLDGGLGGEWKDSKVSRS